MDVEQRAREMSMAMTVEEVAKIISGAPFPSKQSLSKARAVVEFMGNRAALTPPEGSDQSLLELACTFETCIPFLPSAGQRNIRKAVAQLRHMGMGYVLVPMEPTQEMVDQGTQITHSEDWEVRSAWKYMLSHRPYHSEHSLDMVSARPEVKP